MPVKRNRFIKLVGADKSVNRTLEAMSKHDLAARPIYHHKRESIEAHLTIGQPDDGYAVHEHGAAIDLCVGECLNVDQPNTSLRQ